MQVVIGKKKKTKNKKQNLRVGVTPMPYRLVELQLRGPSQQQWPSGGLQRRGSATPRKEDRVVSNDKHISLFKLPDKRLYAHLKV